ncbi:hypothetical protein CL628_04190 [bacterium]|nr:hypothetical protein [bacterium]|tara:strand:- start:259 stop:624 length:366 start_codon:yes stop_codon:yes gene_type:complete
MVDFQRLTIKDAIRSRPLLGLVATSAALNAGLWFAALQFFDRQGAAVVLHYSVDVGIDFVGQGEHITVLPLTGTILLLLNLVVGFAATNADARVSWVLWTTMPLFQVILAAAFFFIWRINF